MSFVRFGSPARNAQPAVAETPAADAVILPAEPAPVAPLGSSGGVLASSPAAAGADLARGAVMTTTKPSRPPTAPAQPARFIPIRIVPRAAVEELVARLVAQEFRHIVTAEGSPYAS